MNVVQIGLGTFCTFIQHLSGGECDVSISWLLEACSERRPESISGIAVEPVPEHLDRLRVPAQRLPFMELVQVAIGEDDTQEELHFLSAATHEAVLRSVPEWQQEAFEAELLYVRNMSCVGTEHPAIERLNEHFSRTYGLRVPIEPVQIEVWTYSRLARELDFCGCEVLLIDAEGYDTQILRSMVEHCEAEEERGRDAWPDVVQFETMGHCDNREGTGAEAAMVKQLKRCGYLLVYWSYYNTVLVRQKALRSQTNEKRTQQLRGWIRTLRCKGCKRRGQHNGQQLPFTSAAGRFYCWPCYKAWKKDDGLPKTYR